MGVCLKTTPDMSAGQEFSCQNGRLASCSWPRRPAGPAIVPVFLPFMGCPARCVFCRQDRQTGRGAHGASSSRYGLAAALSRALRHLWRRRLAGLAPAQLAFYGGTFTALPQEVFRICLDFARNARACGLVSSFRCSTRPDCLDERRLDMMLGAGLSVLELGAQSLDDRVLAMSGRGYTFSDLKRACGVARAFGVPLCLQLLPGMPGHTPDIFASDVRGALALGAAMLRFYPCLVIEGSGLAAMWRGGRYEPWPLAMTVDALARGWLAASRAGAIVIRIGLAPEPDLADAVLAGPLAPDLGGRVLGHALYVAVCEMIAREESRPTCLWLPDFCRGYFLGHRGELASAWRHVGITPESIRFHATPAIKIRFV